MAAAFRDYYKLLGVDPSADETAIRLAYRRLVLRRHPDVARSKNAARRFRELQEAYGVLSDPEKRQRYDRLHGAWERDKAGGAHHPGREEDRASLRQRGVLSQVLGCIVGTLGVGIDAGISVGDLSGGPTPGAPPLGALASGPTGRSRRRKSSAGRRGPAR